MLTLADNLKLPVDAITQTFAILAKRGVGKTHTATVMAEEMLEIGQPIVVYDPTSAWWGLKSSKDGKKPGYPVVIFGGEHADVPLEENAGSTIATVIVEKRIPAVLDVGLLRKGARVRFMTDFCETLYHKNREALHFFVDEAHTIAPQRSMPDQARLLGAMEDIVLQGRRRGLGVTVISQRPALVNKNCTTQCEVLIAMQLTGSHDRKAIEEWVDVHGDDQAKAKEMLTSLSSLQRGEAWVWSPGWLRKLVRTTFRDRRTFDSSATPKVGGRLVTPKSVASIDLAALGDQIKATVEKAKADDPKALRAKIAELSKQLSKPAQTLPKVDPAAIERAYADGLAAGKKLGTEAMFWANRSLQRMKLEFDVLLRELDERCGKQPTPINQSAGKMNRAAANLPQSARELTPAAKSLTKPVNENQPRPAANRIPIRSTENGSLPKGEAAVLSALIQYPAGLRNEQLTVLTAYKRSSRDTYLQKLRERGYVERRGDVHLATDDGRSALPDAAPLPTGAELQQFWLSRLPEGERAILEVLIEAYPHAVLRDQISEATDYKRSSRDTYLQKLRAKELINVNGAAVQASKNLFD